MSSINQESLSKEKSVDSFSSMKKMVNHIYENYYKYSFIDNAVYSLVEFKKSLFNLKYIWLEDPKRIMADFEMQLIKKQYIDKSPQELFNLIDKIEAKDIPSAFFKTIDSKLPQILDYFLKNKKIELNLVNNSKDYFNKAKWAKNTPAIKSFFENKEFNDLLKDEHLVREIVEYSVKEKYPQLLQIILRNKDINLDNFYHPRYSYSHLNHFRNDNAFFSDSYRNLPPEYKEMIKDYLDNKKLEASLKTIKEKIEKATPEKTLETVPGKKKKI